MVFEIAQLFLWKICVSVALTVDSKGNNYKISHYAKGVLLLQFLIRVQKSSISCFVSPQNENMSLTKAV